MKSLHIFTNSHLIGKKTLYLLAFLWLVLSVTWLGLKNKPTTFDLNIVVHDFSLQVPGAMHVDPWSHPQNTPAHRYTLPFPVKSGEHYVLKTKIEAPTGMVRIDFATEKNEYLLIEQLQLSYNNKSTSISPTELARWECIDCEVVLENASSPTTLARLIATSSKPQLIARDFGQYTQDLELKYYHQRPTLRKLTFYAILVTSFSMVLLFLLSYPTHNLRIIALLSTILFASHWGLNSFKKDILQFLAFHQRPAASHMIGFAQYNAFPSHADTLLFLGPFFVVGVITVVAALAKVVQMNTRSSLQKSAEKGTLQ